MNFIPSSCLVVSPSGMVLSGAVSDDPKSKAPSRMRLQLPPEAWDDLPLFARLFASLLAQWQEANGTALRRIQPYFPGRWIQTFSQQVEVKPSTNMSEVELVDAWQRAATPAPEHLALLEELPCDCYEDNRWRIFSLAPVTAKNKLRIVRHQMFADRAPWEMLKTVCQLFGVLLLPPKLTSLGIAQTFSTDGNEPVGLLDLHSSYVTLTLVRQNQLWRSHTLHASSDALAGTILRDVVNIWVKLPGPIQADVHMHILDPHYRLPPSLAAIATEMGISILTGGDADIAYERAWQAEAVQLAARCRVNVSAV